MNEMVTETEYAYADAEFENCELALKHLKRWLEGCGYANAADCVSRILRDLDVLRGAFKDPVL